MAYATKDGSKWRELTAGADIVIDDFATSYASMLAWTPQFRTARGIKEIEETPVPAGKMALSSSIVDQGGKPVRVNVLADDPSLIPTAADVNLERDRRIRAGFMFAGTPFDYDDSSQKRITGAATLAGFAAAAGAQPGDLRWHGGDGDFVWIAQDNSLVPMDAPTCFTFGQAAAAWESANVFAAKAIKDSGIPANYADDALWPAL